MIRVNLTGVPKKKAAKVAARSGGPSNLLPVVHVLILAGTAVAGYLWYSDLTAQGAELTANISQREAQLKQLEAVIKQDQVFEARKATLENRIQIIEGLRKNQVSPLLILDMLGDAIDKTHFVWLSNLSQNNATVSMTGTATSVDALADLVRNMESTGYFHNINPQRFEDSRGNFSFNMTCEFAPPTPTPAPGEKGAN